MIRDNFTPRPDGRAGELCEAEYEQQDECSLSIDWLNVIVWGSIVLAVIGFWAWVIAVVIDWFK